MEKVVCVQGTNIKRCISTEMTYKTTAQRPVYPVFPRQNITANPTAIVAAHIGPLEYTNNTKLKLIIIFLLVNG